MAALKSLTLSDFLTSLPSISPSPSLSPSPPASIVSLPRRRDDLPKSASLATQPAIIALNPKSPSSSSSGIADVVFPSLARSSALFFKSAYNVQVFAEENEPEERLLFRFRREVFKAGVLQECRRRRFFENSHDRRKRKAREAARRNRKRPRQAKASRMAKQETPKLKEKNEGDDNWDYYDVDLPY